VLITPGPFAPTVTQHVPTASTTDRYGNPTTTWTDKAQVVLAQFPGNSMEDDTAAANTVIADLVLLVAPTVAVTSQDEWTASDGLRYRTEGQPERYKHPMTGTAITQVNLRRIT
jgi:hypothetical protein